MDKEMLIRESYHFLSRMERILTEIDIKLGIAKRGEELWD